VLLAKIKKNYRKTEKIHQNGNFIVESQLAIINLPDDDDDEHDDHQ
jgi:hypothetical protein